MDLVNYEDLLPAGWRKTASHPVSKSPSMAPEATAKYGSSTCPNSPNACYCSGACNKPKSIDMPITAPSFVEEHNAQKDVTTNCNTRDYQRPQDLAPTTQAALDDLQRTIGADARSNSANDRALLQTRINSGELAPGLNAGRIVMPKEAQFMDLQEVRALMQKKDNENFVFAPLKNVLTGLEEVLRYKNKAYGNSGLSEVGIMSKASALEKLLARADDKIARIKNSETLRKNDVCDLMGYLVLICAKQGWNNFSDQLD